MASRTAASSSITSTKISALCRAAGSAASGTAGLGAQAGQGQTETGADAGLRMQFKREAQQPAQPVDDGEAQAEAFFPVAFRVVQLDEFVEDLFLVSRRDADAGVGDFDLHPVALLATGDANPAGGGVAQGVAEQVAQDGDQQDRVGANPGLSGGRSPGQALVASLGSRSTRLNREPRLAPTNQGNTCGTLFRSNVTDC